MSSDKSSLSVLYNYEARLASDKLVAVRGEGALSFELDEEGKAGISWTGSFSGSEGTVPSKLFFTSLLESVLTRLS